MECVNIVEIMMRLVYMFLGTVLLLEICGCKLSHWFKFNLEGDLDWIADIRWKEL
jgi:hypothetical protein